MKRSSLGEAGLHRWEKAARSAVPAPRRPQTGKKRLMRRAPVCAGVLAVVAGTAIAGPPYVSDDPEPTDYQHYEIYLFTDGMTARDGTSGASGVDFNYGGMPDLQLTAVTPVAFDSPTAGSTVAGRGNIG